METQVMRVLPDVRAATGTSQKLVVMTYNVLAQCYVRSSLFPYCRSGNLRWKKRSKLLEVDNYHEFWVGALQKLGYEGHFVKKTSNKQDGVAVFWNADKLKVKRSKTVSLDLPVGDESDIDRELLSRTCRRGSVGAIVHFEHVGTQLEFVVATTHLYWDPMQADVKLLQSRRMLRAITTFVSTLDASLPTIFSGDFNSLPDSKVYDFITSCNDFKSAYSLYDVDGEPKFTNVNGSAETSDGRQVARFVGTLDYIFYRSHRMRPVALMEIMSIEDASREVALPSAISPSDHVPLLCEFQILLK
ncbi:unnamed protein product [Hyaloperonospora brassicae]|uniref:Endonuclease/exonuclease/phosphatase domain-containing protein n=1 Tax=Hyaloperonospora brassicae TaxID=162125 RepID=A0AAV0THI2_HYABA|nr:unnamed protein product [Hyaloperonospora brassicae]